MKKVSVYALLLIFLAFCLLGTTACARKSGCAAIDKTVQPKTKKRGAKRDIIGRKM